MKKNIDERLRFVINLSKIQAILSKRFDSGLGNGLGFNEFLILFNLSNAENKKMRRVDIAEKIGLSASGVTRMLLPMEKIGLIKSEARSEDARVRSVSLTKGGKEKMEEAMQSLEYLLDDLIPSKDKAALFSAQELLINIGTRLLMN